MLKDALGRPVRVGDTVAWFPWESDENKDKTPVATMKRLSYGVISGIEFERYRFDGRGWVYLTVKVNKHFMSLKDTSLRTAYEYENPYFVRIDSNSNYGYVYPGQWAMQECTREPHEGPCNGLPCAYVRDMLILKEYKENMHSMYSVQEEKTPAFVEVLESNAKFKDQDLPKSVPGKLETRNEKVKAGFEINYHSRTWRCGFCYGDELFTEDSPERCAELLRNHQNTLSHRDNELEWFERRVKEARLEYQKASARLFPLSGVGVVNKDG
jgi:hypothetical protein